MGVYPYPTPAQPVRLEGGWQWTGREITITTTAQIVSGANAQRFGLMLVNTGAVTIRISPISNETGNAGFPLLSNAIVSMTHHADVWAWTASSTSTLGILEEVS